MPQGIKIDDRMLRGCKKAPDQMRSDEACPSGYEDSHSASSGIKGQRGCGARYRRYSMGQRDKGDKPNRRSEGRLRHSLEQHWVKTWHESLEVLDQIIFVAL